MKSLYDTYLGLQFKSVCESIKDDANRELFDRLYNAAVKNEKLSQAELKEIQKKGFKADDNTFKHIVYCFVKVSGDMKCDLNWIDTSEVTDMSHLFELNNPMARTFLYKFNGDISKWDTSNVVNMACMFKGSYFNGDISKWDVSKVTNMFAMFMESDFNKDISNWNTASVLNMSWMFASSKFTGDISKWKVPVECAGRGLLKMFLGCKISEDNKPKFAKLEKQL